MKRENNDDGQTQFQNQNQNQGGGGGGGGNQQGGGPPNKRNRRNDDQVRLLIPSRIAGAVIGKGGQHIQKMRQQYSATVSVDDCQGPERTILIGSDLDSVCAIISEMLKYFEIRDDEVDVRMLIHQSLAGCVIGKGGSKIKEIRDRIGCRILKVFSNVAPQSSDRVVQSIGKPEQTVEAVREVVNLIRETPIKGTIHNYDPINYDDFYADEYGGFGQGGGGGNNGNNGNFRGERGGNQGNRFNDRGGNNNRGGNRFNDKGGNRGGGDRGNNRGGNNFNRGGGGGSGGRNDGGNDREFISPWANNGNDGGFGGNSMGGGGGFGGSNQGGSTFGSGNFGSNSQGGGSSNFGGGSGGNFGQGGGNFGPPSGGFGGNNPSGGFGQGANFNQGGGSNPGGNFNSGNQGGFGGSNQGGFGGSQGNMNSNGSNFGSAPPMGGMGGGNQGVQGGNNSAQQQHDPNNSTQVTIPKDLAGAIIGKGGGRIRRIRNESGAYITIDEPLPGSNDRIITISGTPKQIQMAQYLLQQRVREGM